MAAISLKSQVKEKNITTKDQSARADFLFRKNRPDIKLGGSVV
jgi:hypothetical protein